MPKSAIIESFLVWVRFSILPVEYHTYKWLVRAGNKIRRTVKVDRTMLLASQGKFVRVCVEIDLTKLVKAGYKFRGILQEVNMKVSMSYAFIVANMGIDI